MTSNRILSNSALAMMALPVILGASLCYLRPEGAWLWVVAMICLPVSWFGIKARGMGFGTTIGGALTIPAENSSAARKAIALAMIFASLVVALPLGAKLADALGLIDKSLALAIATRWVNVLAGAYFVFRGNRLPKMLTPLSEARGDPATMQILQRGTGWAYVLAGFIFALVWLVMPVHRAQPIGMAVIAAGILVPTFIMRSCAKRRSELLNH